MKAFVGITDRELLDLISRRPHPGILLYILTASLFRPSFKHLFGGLTHDHPELS